MKTISVIIPVYNGEQHLAECLNSAINQTYKSLEIIIVNDGSTDGTADILTQYAKKDSRIIVINQAKNHGVSASRNIGLGQAAGEYIMFIDADDYISRDYVERLYSYAVSNSLDIVKTSYTSFDENGTHATRSIVTEKQKTLSWEEVKNIFVNTCRFNAVHTQLVRKELIVDNNLTFVEDAQYAEDMMFNYTLMQKARTVGWLNYPGYHCRDNKSSASRIGNIEKQQKNILDCLSAYQILMDGTNKNDYDVAKKIFSISSSLARQMRPIKNYDKFEKCLRLIYSSENYKKIREKIRCLTIRDFRHPYFILFYYQRTRIFAWIINMLGGRNG